MPQYKLIFFSLFILFSIASAQNPTDLTILVGKNGNKAEILRGVNLKEQLFPNLQVRFKDVGNSIRSKLYSLESQKDIESKMNISLENFKYLGFSLDLASIERERKKVYIYELSITRQVCEFGEYSISEVYKNHPSIEAMNWTTFVKKYGNHVISRQEINSYVYLYILTENTERVEQNKIESVFKIYLERENLEVNLNTVLDQQVKSYISKIEFIIDGIDYNKMQEKEVINCLAKKDFTKLKFSNPLRTSLTFYDLPGLFGKYPSHKDIFLMLSNNKYTKRWYATRESEYDPKVHKDVNVTKVEKNLIKKTINIYYDHQDGYIEIATDKIVSNGEKVTMEGTWHQFYTLFNIEYNGPVYLELKENEEFEGWWKDKASDPERKLQLLKRQE